MQNKSKLPQKSFQAKKKVAPKKQEELKTSLLLKLDNYFGKNRKTFFFITCIASVLFSFLLFDVKLSNANDDSFYLQAAWDITKDIHSLFSGNAPLYPIFLSIFI